MEHNSVHLDVKMPPAQTCGPRHLLADIKKKTLRNRILSALFGEGHEVVIILPSRNVDSVTFTRTGEDGEQR